MCIIAQNAFVTVDNMRGFSAIFASQAGALQTERRKTEDLLTEMLPRSVAKQLRAGKTVPAEEYDVRTSYAVVTTTIRLDLTAVRQPFDCLSKVIKVTLTQQPPSRSRADLFIYVCLSAAEGS